MLKQMTSSLCMCYIVCTSIAIFNHRHCRRPQLLRVYMCECSIGVHVRDGTTIFLISIVVHVVMGCIAVLGRQMNVDFSISDCKNTIPFVGMDVCFCTPRTSTTLNSHA